MISIVRRIIIAVAVVPYCFAVLGFLFSYTGFGFQRLIKWADKGSLIALRLESEEFVFNRHRYEGGHSEWHESDGYGSISGWEGPWRIESLPAWTLTRPVYVDQPPHVFWPTRELAKGAYPYYDGHSVAYGYRYSNLHIRVPYKFLVVVFGLPLLLLAGVARLQRRYRRHLIACGICLKCGYDLRESEDRCPECGTPVGKKGSGVISLDAVRAHR